MKMPKKSKLEKIIASIVNEIPVSFFITDEDGRIIYANRAVTEITGYSEKELLGRNPRIFKSGKHPRAFYSEMWRSLKSGRPFNARMTNRNKDGSEDIFNVCIHPFRSPSGETYYATIRFAIGDLLKLENILEKEKKLAVIGLMTAQLVHNFRNLLTIIMGSLEVAKEEKGLSGEARNLLGKAMNSAVESRELLNELLVFSREDESRANLISLEDTISETTGILNEIAGKNVEIHYSLGRKRALISVSPRVLKQILVNMITNSSQAMKGRGGISIKTGVRAVSRRRGALKPGKYAFIEISDSGPGVKKNEVEKIFQPFYTTKPKGEGTGLGLFYVRKIALKSGGDIIYSANKPRGAKFTVFLPVSRG